MRESLLECVGASRTKRRSATRKKPESHEAQGLQLTPTRFKTASGVAESFADRPEKRSDPAGAGGFDQPKYPFFPFFIARWVVGVLRNNGFTEKRTTQ
jgi:hypothetical protein